MASDKVTDQKQPVGITWESDANQFILFDATLNEDHTSRSQLTSYPIEEGADRSDHIRRMRDELGLLAVVTDSPLVKNGQDMVPANTGGDVGQRAVSAYNFLVQTKDQGRLVSVFTTLRTYRNMAIESIDVARDASKSNIIEANIRLKEMLIAITEQVEAPTPAKKAPVRVKKAKRGKKNKNKASDANKAKGRETSLALKAGRSISSALGL